MVWIATVTVRVCYEQGFFKWWSRNTWYKNLTVALSGKILSRAIWNPSNSLWASLVNLVSVLSSSSPFGGGWGRLALISEDLPWWGAFTLARFIESSPGTFNASSSSLAHLLVTYCLVLLGQKSPQKEFRASLYMYVAYVCVCVWQLIIHINKVVSSPCAVFTLKVLAHWGLVFT